MDPEYLFIERCKQLSALLESQELIKILDIAFCLRALILDKHSLVDAVNQNGFRLKFDVGYFPTEPDPYAHTVVFYSLGDGIDPQTSRSGRSKRLGIQEFLQHHVLTVRQEQKSVKDTIKYATTTAGAVHWTPTPKEEHELIDQVSKNLFIGGLPAGLQCMKAIGRVTLRGLQPLLDDVTKRTLYS